MPLETEPLDILLDETGDIVVDPVVGITFVSGLEGVGQLCVIALRLWEGEWIYDIEEGMPYLRTILGQKYSSDAIRDAAGKALRGVPYVTEVGSLAVTFDPTIRKASLTGNVKTVFGDLEITTEVP